MKKSIFCVLFALLVSLFAVAVAENTGCCACCTGANCASAIATSADDARTIRPSKYDIEGFATEVDQGDFKVFLPSTFETNGELSGRNTYIYRSVYSSFYPFVEMSPEPRHFDTQTVPAFYTDREELRHSLDLHAAYNSESEVIQLDECLGLMHISSSSSGFTIAVITATNRKDICVIYVEGETSDEARELAYAIIDHAVAKEIPLEELAPAE